MMRPQAPSRGSLGLSARELAPDVLSVRPIEPSPCSRACPAGVNVKAYVSLIAEGRFERALEVVRERCPLPAVCGRVCTHPCERACLRADTDEPVAIRALKRFVADLEAELPPPPRTKPWRAERVAVVGSGPAGLTAAYDLAQAGYPITVFESGAEPGGMLRQGIAPYRLPHDVLEREIDHLLRSGIELRTSCRLGHDVEIEELEREGFRAIVLAVGAPRGRGATFPGADDPAVGDALSFLRASNAGERAHPGRQVLVIGGGSTAVEAARTALRLGAESVRVLYRRTRAEMPADDEEVTAAEAEGVRFRYLIAPVRATVAYGRVWGLHCEHMRLGEPDASGRPRPVPIPASEILFEADRVLLAVGQETDLSFLPPRLRTRLEERGLLRADPASGATGISGVFAAGDVVRGPATVVDAIADGHTAAEAVRRHLKDPDVDRSASRPAACALEYTVLPDRPAPAARHHPSVRPVERGREFAEVEEVFDAAEAVAEARRCLRCGPCSECAVCAASCGHRHLELRIADGAGPGLYLRAPAALARGLDHPAQGALHHRAGLGSGGTPIELAPLARRVETRRCRGCGACLEVCPFDAVHLTADGRPEPVARIEAFYCRGCGLCAGACPTGAVLALAGADAARTAGVVECFAARAAPAGTEAWITCLGSAHELELERERRGIRAEILTVPCVGELTSGALVGLAERAAARVVVAGCGPAGCRFGRGAELAGERVREARAFLALAGHDPNGVVAAAGGLPVPAGAGPEREAAGES